MKKSVLTLVSLVATASTLLAQSLTPSSPYFTAVKLFDSTAGFTITGMAAAPNGDVYYIETDSTFSVSTKLYRRSAASNYAAPVTLFDFGAAVFGSFVSLHEGMVLFGENSTGTIRALDANLSIDALGIVPSNYDIAYAGGALFLSHNPGGIFSPTNRVSRFTLQPDGSGGLQLSAADLILDTVNDYSGGLAFDGAGNLFYGGSGSYGVPDLYRFTAAEVTAATGSGPTLAIDGAHYYLATGTDAYLAARDEDELWHTDFATLNLIGADSPSLGQVAISTDSIGHLSAHGSDVFVSVTNSSFDRSAVFVVAPEPSIGALIALGVTFAASRRQRRRFAA